MKPVFCPYCRKGPLIRTWSAPGQDLNRQYQSAISVCNQCAGICVIQPDGDRRKILPEELAAIAPEARKVLDDAVTMTRFKIRQVN